MTEGRSPRGPEDVREAAARIVVDWACQFRPVSPTSMVGVRLTRLETQIPWKYVASDSPDAPTYLRALRASCLEPTVERLKSLEQAQCLEGDLAAKREASIDALRMLGGDWRRVFPPRFPGVTRACDRFLVEELALARRMVIAVDALVLAHDSQLNVRGEKLRIVRSGTEIAADSVDQLADMLKLVAAEPISDQAGQWRVAEIGDEALARVTDYVQKLTPFAERVVDAVDSLSHASAPVIQGLA